MDLIDLIEHNHKKANYIEFHHNAFYARVVVKKVIGHRNIIVYARASATINGVISDIKSKWT